MDANPLQGAAADPATSSTPAANPLQGAAADPATSRASAAGDLTSLPFDQYQRYRILQEAVDALRWQPRLNVLDVGGSPATLKAFLPNDWVVVADVADQGGLDLYANGLALPFADQAFDVVTACDTLEHVPPRDRLAFLSQLARVAGEVLLIAAPFDDPRVNAAEDVLQEVIRARYGEGFHFLEEHRAYGLPDVAETEAHLRALGFETVVLPSGYVHRWLVALSVFFLLQWRYHDAELNARLNRYYNESFYHADNREPSYRKVIVATRGRDASALPGLLSAPSPAAEPDPTAHFQALGSLLTALTEGWSRRAVAAEARGLELEAEVGEREAEVGEREADVGELERQVGQLQAHLADAERHLADAERRLGLADAELQVQRGEAEALRAQVAAHQQNLDAITSSRAWRLIRLLWDVRTRAVPRGSRQERALRAALHAGRVAQREGAVPLARIVVPYPARRFLRRTVFKKAPSPGLAGPGSAAGISAGDWAAQATRAAPTDDAQATRAAPTYDVVVFPIIDWDFRFQRPQQLARRLARAGHRVLYVSTAFQGGAAPLLRTIEENVVGVQLPGSRYTNLYTDTVHEQLRDRLLAAFAEIRDELHVAEAVCIVDLPFWAPLAFALRERYGWKLVYDCMDDYGSFSTVGRRMLRAEDELSAGSDLVLASSRGIRAAQSRHNPRCLLVPNAVDFEHFHRAPPLPHDLADVSRPIVGYYGAISDWFDSALVADLARARPQWSFVLVGSTFGADLAPLGGLRNVRTLGEKPYAEIAAYAHAFDVCIIPFQRTPLTDATNPVKLFEYLAAGKPVVATRLGELEHYAEHAQLVSGQEEWLAALERALQPAPAAVLQARVAFARENDWDHRAATVRESVQALYPLASIVVVTYNNLEYTRLCLDSLYAQTVYPRVEIVVVDNASQDGTPEFLKEFEASHDNFVAILNDRNTGFAAANNQGMAAARGEYLVFLNNDTVVTRGWLPRLLYHLRDPAVGMIGPVTNSSGNESRIEVDYTTTSDMEAFARRYSRAHFAETFDIRMLALFCVAMRRAVVDDVGGLDERFGIGMFEDDDYALRVRQKGYRIVCAEDVFIHHWGSASFSKLADATYRALFDENQRKFEEKWGRKWQPHRYREAGA